jgi:lysozyme family protein
MVALTYQPTIDRIIHSYEGGYGWNKSDPGGPTKYGITCYDLAEFMGQKMDSMARWAPIVQAMTLETAEAIYKKKYAAGIMYDDLPAGVDADMLDYGINSGVARPILVAQRLCGFTGRDLDSRMGPKTLAAIKAQDPTKFINAMCDERLQFMRAIDGGKMWTTFGHGWSNRVADLRTYSTHLVTTGTPAAPPAAADITHLVQPKATNVAKTAGAPSAGGALTAGVASATAGAPHWITAASVMAPLIIGTAYEAWQDYKANLANSTVHVAS